MGGREVSRPYRVWFFAEGERYLSAQPSCACLTNDELVVCSMKKSIHIGEDVDA